MALTLFLLLFLIFSLVVLFVVTSAFLGFILTRVPFVPTPAENVKLVVDRLGITDRDVFYDLGSGDGKVCFLVNKLTGAKCVGFELTWWTYALAILKLKVKNIKSNIEFKNLNFFKQSWSDANYIYGYLYPPLMGRVEEKFLAEGKSGSTAIMRDFPFPNLEPDNVLFLPRGHKIFIYRHA